MQIAITAGHGGTDPGAVNARLRLSEAGLATELRDTVAYILRSRGFTVVEDGAANGENQPLREAIKLVAGRVAVEIHFNAGPQGATGVEAISLPGLKRLAQGLSQAVAGVLRAKLRGDKGWIDQTKSQHHRLAFVQAGGVILEVAFISNDADMIFYQANSAKVAHAIAGAVADYLEDVDP